jgi:hypothetical protein
MKNVENKINDIADLAIGSGNFTRLTKQNKKMEIEKRNVIAGLKIAAGIALRGQNTTSPIKELSSTVKDVILSDKIPVKVYLEIFDSRIASLEKRIEALKDKEAITGKLSASEKASFVQFEDAIKDVKAERKSFLEDHKPKE